MAVAYDNKIVMNNTSGNFTVGNNKNRILIINSVGNTTPPTFNGVSFTKYTPASGIMGYTYVYYLLSPTVGEHTLNTTGHTYAICASFYNVDLRHPFGKINTPVDFGGFGNAGTQTQTIANTYAKSVDLEFSYGVTDYFDQITLQGVSTGQVDLGVLFNDRLHSTAWSYELGPAHGNNTMGRGHANSTNGATTFMFLLELKGKYSPVPTSFNP